MRGVIAFEYTIPVKSANPDKTTAMTRASLAKEDCTRKRPTKGEALLSSETPLIMMNQTRNSEGSRIAPPNRLCLRRGPALWPMLARGHHG